MEVWHCTSPKALLNILLESGELNSYHIVIKLFVLQRVKDWWVFQQLVKDSSSDCI